MKYEAIGKYAAIGLILCAGAAQAESLCGATDADAMLALLHGDWQVSGGVSVETQTVSVVEPVLAGVQIDRSGRVALEFGEEPAEPLILQSGLGGFDVDQVDDFLETVEADWVADQVSDTPCGPEGLLQLREVSQPEDGASTRVTVLPYFDDRLVMIVEVETVGDWGIAFVTLAGLVTRGAGDAPLGPIQEPEQEPEPSEE